VPLFLRDMWRRDIGARPVVCGKRREPPAGVFGPRRRWGFAVRMVCGLV